MRQQHDNCLSFPLSEKYLKGKKKIELTMVLDVNDAIFKVYIVPSYKNLLTDKQLHP